MKKNHIVPILCLVGLMSFVVLGSSPELVGKIIESAQDNPITRIFSSEVRSETRKPDIEFSEKIQRSKINDEKMPEQQNEIPEYILYGQIFHLVIEFNELAKSQKAKGEPVTKFGTYFKDEAKLTTQEDALLTQTSNDYIQDAELIDARAEIVIEQLKQQFPVGSLPEGELIKPSPELLQLQEQRNKLALVYRDKLKDLLGETRFNEFDTFVKGNFASGVKLISNPTEQNIDNQGGEK